MIGQTIERDTCFCLQTAHTRRQVETSGASRHKYPASLDFRKQFLATVSTCRRTLAHAAISVFDPSTRSDQTAIVVSGDKNRHVCCRLNGRSALDAINK